MKKYILIILAISAIFPSKLPNDVRWVTNSNEYNMLCNQIYNNASKELDKYLKSNRKNKNLAIVMDLDETVLDNSQYQIEIFNRNETFNMESWANWVLREEAKLVPGARKYINKLRKNNVKIIFISNRMHERLKATKNNLKKLGIFSKNDIFLLRKDKKDKKNVRRNEIYKSINRMKKHKNFTVIQYLGDAMGDFPNKEKKDFGYSQFIFPNPMYGKW